MSEATIRGYCIHYRGAGSGRVVLFLHGLAGASGFWSDTLRRLPEGFQGLAPDLLGFGDSDKPRIPYSIAAHAGMVKELAARLGLSKFDLVGHSMGGMIALTMALVSPAQVGKLVLVNTPVSGRTALHGRGRIGATYPGLLLVKMGLQIPWILSLLRKMKRYYFVLDPRFTEDANKAPLYSLKSHAEALCRTSLRERLREVAVPTLVMGTAQDGIVRPSEFSLAGEKIPGAETVWVRDAGHCPTLEMPDESHAAIFNFLKP